MNFVQDKPFFEIFSELCCIEIFKIALKVFKEASKNF
jgi:hypothetical protein